MCVTGVSGINRKAPEATGPGRGETGVSSKKGPQLPNSPVEIGNVMLAKTSISKGGKNATGAKNLEILIPRLVKSKTMSRALTHSLHENKHLKSTHQKIKIDFHP